jgi:NAD(P)-dependent dehydrogenase (short-subunit alcohol dehydrogenase family)
LSDEEQVAALVERTVASFGRLDFAFNNAGGFYAGCWIRTSENTHPQGDEGCIIILRARKRARALSGTPARF